MNVDKVMTRAVFSCRANDPLAIPAQIMWEHDVGAVPVIDENGIAKAMITDRDIAMACYLNAVPPTRLNVSDVMSKHLFAAKPNQSVQAAEEIMRREQVRRLPVVDDSRKLIGIVTLGDLARAAGEGHPRRQAGIEPDEVAVTLAAVTTPRPDGAIAGHPA